VFNRTWNGWNTTLGMGAATGIGRWLRVLGVGAALAATLPGCMAHARGELVYDYPVTYVDVAPARVETYPSAYYHGRPAYLVDGRWYYRSGPRWVYFREEPVELRDYRVRHYDHGRGERYSDVMEHRRAERYREERLARDRAERRHAEQRREAQHRAEMRRLEQRRDAERRAEARRREERREADARRAAEQRRELEERRAAQRRDERKGRVADRHPNDNRRRARDRDRDRDDRRDDRRD